MFQKAKFDKYKEAYKSKLTNNPNPNIVLWNECLSTFKQHWDLEHLDLKSMYDRSLKSQINTTLWKGDDYHPKEVMMAFMDYEKEIVRSILRDLLDEKREIGGRMERFVFYCDQLLKEIQQRKSKFYGHYHTDYFVVSLYLTFVYPLNYIFYDYEIFRRSMINMGAKTPPLTNELERYFKITKVVDKFLSQDTELIDCYSNVVTSSELKERKTLFMAFDFLKFVAKNQLN